MLHEFIAANRAEIIERCKAKVSLRSVPPPSDPERNHGVPVFLDQVTQALRLGLTSTPEIGRSAVQHGHDLLEQGFTVSQVVHDYGDVCQAITELATETDTPIVTEDFRTLNRCLDEAIAGAVTEYGRAHHQSVIEDESERGSQRLGFFAHELRNLINVAIVSFDGLKSGNAGLCGSTSAVLERSLLSLRSLIAGSLAELRLTHGIQNRERFGVASFIAELASSATVLSAARGIGLLVAPVEEDLGIEGDRQVLTAVVDNLLQNAFKFTRPRTTVTVRVGASQERVLIEVQDECGGLAGGNTSTLFRPFEQRSDDRSGLGLGLAFSRWGAEANGGQIRVRNLPDQGCIFTLDLPRFAIPAPASA